MIKNFENLTSFFFFRCPLYDFKKLKKDTIPERGSLEEGATLTSIEAKYLINFSIYSNPANEKITISRESAIQTATKYSVFNISGKIVKVGFTEESGTMNISTLSLGEYLIRAYGDKIYQTRFSVIR